MATAREWQDTINAAFKTVELEGYRIEFCPGDLAGQYVMVRENKPKTEVELLREEIERLKSQLSTPFSAAGYETTYENQPEPDGIMPSKALMSFQSLMELNEKYAVGLKYDSDFDLFRVYADRQYAGAADKQEVDRLVLSVKLQPGENIAGKTYTFGRGFMKQYAENAKTQPRRPRRVYPAINVPNLYVDRDPSATSGPAYELQ